MKAHAGTSDGTPRGGFFALIVSRPVALMVAFATLLVVGAIAYLRIPMQLLPSGFSEPEVNIWIPNSGASAQENEEQVARVVEEQLRTLTGIEELESYSDEDSVYFDMDFDARIDMDLAKAEVRDRLERARPLLPDTAENPAVWTESASSLPVTYFGIRLKGDPETRDYLIEKHVLPRLEAVHGIGRVTLFGVLQDSVRILLDEDKVIAAQLDIGGVIRRLMTDNFAMPMGDVDDGGREFILRSDMRFKSLEEIAEFPIGDGLKLKDVARVARVKSVGDSLSHIDGGIAYYGMASKDSQSNVVETSRNWARTLEELEDDPVLEGRMSYMVFFLQGEMIEDALSQLRGTAMWGGILALVVLFAFLRRVRLTLCVALAIPVSSLLAIAWQYFTGGSFNVLTMTGITLGIGMLVDNAVVVVENIARLHREGQDPSAAAVVGTRQIALAVTLATLTTVVVFMPLIFMTDDPMVRVIFGGLGIPLSVSLLASLAVAVVFLPVITAQLLGERSPRTARVAEWLAPIAALPVRVIARIVGALRATWFAFVSGLFIANRIGLFVLAKLRWPLALAAAGLVAWRWIAVGQVTGFGKDLARFGIPLGGGDQGMLLLIVVLLALGVPLVALLLGSKLLLRRPALPPERPARFVPAGTSLIDMVTELNHRLVEWTLSHRLAACGLSVAALASIAIPLLSMEVTPFGQDSRTDSVEFGVIFNASFSLAEAVDEISLYEEFLESKREQYGFDHWISQFDEVDGRLSMYWDEPQSKEFFEALEKRVRDELPRVPGHTIVFYDEESTGDRSQSVARFTLRGPESAELERLGKQAQRLLQGVPGLSQVTTPSQTAPDQINVDVDRDMANMLGVDTNAIQQTIAWALRGFALPRYQEQGRDVPFLIEFDEEDVAGLSTLRDLGVFGDEGTFPLASVAKLSFDKGSRRIYRRDGQTSFTLVAKVDDPLRVIPITEAGYRALGTLDLPRGYTIDRDNSAMQRQQEEFGELFKAFLLSVVLVFLLMGILFESILLPFSVLFTIPYAIMGSMWTLFLVGTPIDSMGWIGMIILAGVVVNNGIVLIDRIHALRPEEPTRARAVLLGCSQRVRPVLMTALTTVCGLFPMIVTPPPSNNGFDYRALATIVAGGLIASTFFTLWVVPLAYTILDDLAGVFRARMTWWTRRPARAAGGPTPAAAGRLKR